MSGNRMLLGSVTDLPCWLKFMEPCASGGISSSRVLLPESAPSLGLHLDPPLDSPDLQPRRSEPEWGRPEPTWEQDVGHRGECVLAATAWLD